MPHAPLDFLHSKKGDTCVRQNLSSLGSAHLSGPAVSLWDSALSGSTPASESCAASIADAGSGAADKFWMDHTDTEGKSRGIVRGCRRGGGPGSKIA